MDDASLESYLEEWAHSSARSTSESVDRLCEIYLVATPPQRASILVRFADEALFRRVFDSYLGRVYEQLASTGEVRWLKIGLAVHSLENNRQDWRDVLVGLSDLWLRAEKAGIDPAASFEEVAAKSSNTALYDSGYSMQGLMADIGDSACLAEMRDYLDTAG